MSSLDIILPRFYMIFVEIGQYKYIAFSPVVNGFLYTKNIYYFTDCCGLYFLKTGNTQPRRC